MFSRLTALAGLGGASLPFELGEPQPCHFGSWQHYRGTARADGAPVSVWRLAAPSKSDARLEAGRHGVKRLRMTRHPGVLGFRDSVEVEEKGEAVLYLVTEPVTPLAEVLRGMAVSALLLPLLGVPWELGLGTHACRGSGAATWQPMRPSRG